MIPAFITFHQLLFMKLFAKVSKKSYYANKCVIFLIDY